MKCKDCVYMRKDNNPSFGWCENPKRRIEACSAFPTGTLPSTGGEHSCENFKSKNSERAEDVK